MKCVVALLALLLIMSACSRSAEPTFVPVEQQNVLTRMTRAAGYEVAGVPYYKDGRWMSNVRIANCTSNITVEAQKSAEPVHPISFTVSSIDSIPLSELSPNTSGLFLLARELKALPRVAEHLGCNS